MCSPRRAIENAPAATRAHLHREEFRQDKRLARLRNACSEDGK